MIEELTGAYLRSAGEPETFTPADLRASAEMTEAIVADAEKRWG
jgi:hypothetical protein